MSSAVALWHRRQKAAACCLMSSAVLHSLERLGCVDGADCCVFSLRDAKGQRVRGGLPKCLREGKVMSP